MRIAFVTPEYVTENSFDGGLANYLGRVCPFLVESGHDVIVIVASDVEGCFIRNGVEVHRVTINATVLSLLNKVTRKRMQSAVLWVLRSLAYRRVCAKIHRERPIDIIQYASFSATGLFRLKNVPAVVRLSSYEPLWQKAYEWPANLDNRLRGWLEKLAINISDAVFGPSRAVAAIVADAYGKPVEVIEPPFALDHVEQDDSVYRDSLEGKKYLLFFGTLGRLKGVHTIAAVIRPLLQDDEDLYFVFIGKDFGYRGRPIIEHVWEKSGPCRSRVLYLGQMRHSQIYPVLAHASAVILPSRVDNLPNVCLEAMALKRVVVGTRGASFEQLIVDKESGFLCAPDSPDELLEAIVKALSLSDIERERIGERAADRIGMLHPEKAVKELLDFYRAIA